MRTVKMKNPKTYLDTQGIAQHYQVVEKSLPFEFMLNALRLWKPIDWVLFESRTGLCRSVLQPIIQAAAAKKLISYDTNCLETTDLGKQFLNNLIEMFLP